MRIIWIFFILQYSLVAFGQHQVQGYLVNHFGEALQNAKLSVQSTNTYVYSDAQGYFRITLPETFKVGDLTIITPEGAIFKIPLDFRRQSKIDLGRWELSLSSANEESKSQVDWEALMEHPLR